MSRHNHGLTSALGPQGVFYRQTYMYYLTSYHNALHTVSYIIFQGFPREQVYFCSHYVIELLH